MAQGQYQKLRLIGSGGFGSVYLVQKSSTAVPITSSQQQQQQQQQHEGRELVLKEVDLSGMDTVQRQKAEAEAKVLNSLRHPYIVRYWESYATRDDRLCIIMDYCEGGDLNHYIRQQRQTSETIPEAQVLRWFTEMCIAVKHMHSRNVMHRDIKTGNIFLARREDTGRLCVKFADFGIATVLPTQESFAKTLIGTPSYLSPEICQKQPYSFASDVWALGCVLYELCALQPAFTGPDIHALLRKIVLRPPPMLPETYSRELNSIGADLLSHEPGLRPSASALLQKSLLQDEIRRMLAERRTVNSGADSVATKAAGKVQQEPAAKPTQEGGAQPPAQHQQSAHHAVDAESMEHRASCSGLPTQAKKAQPSIVAEVTATAQAARKTPGPRCGRQQRARRDVQGPRSAARVTVTATPCRSPPCCAAQVPSRIPPQGCAQKPPARRAACDSRSCSSRRAVSCRCLPRLPIRRHTRIAPLQ